MGNNCSCDNDVANQDVNVNFKQINSEDKATTRIKYTNATPSSYDPLKIKHDPDIVSKNPFKYTSDE
jgi:hypothetical protein